MNEAAWPMISSSERVMLVAPHPDDETLAAGGLLQRASRAGAPIRILFATNGDNNLWMHRIMERRWQIGPDDRARYGQRRQEEARAALARLGVGEEAACFLGHPDLGLTGELVHGDGEMVETLTREIRQWRPTLLIIPSAYDWHPDHSALAVMSQLALSQAGAEARPAQVISYMNHGSHILPAGHRVVKILSNPQEAAATRAAMLCHASQLAFRRKWILAGLSESDEFILDEGARSASAFHPLRSATWGEKTLWLELRQHARLGAFGPTTLHLVSSAAEGKNISLALELRWDRKEAEIRSLPDGKPVGQARLRPQRGGGFVLLPRELLGGEQRLFVKLERRHGFFDEAGWIEVRTPPTEESREGAAEGAPATATKSEQATCAVVPCYNVASLCGPVVREAARYADHVIAVDDGSTDATGQVLSEIAALSNGRITLVRLEQNQGKGNALMAAFQHALSTIPFDVLVTLDGDGQHRPEDIPLLAAACRDGAEFVIGERLELNEMPLRSRIGNTATAALLKKIFPGCPTDTQSGFRATDRRFLKLITSSIKGRRYETELLILLLALEKRLRIDTVPIPTIYLNANRASHFRPLTDSARICNALVGWILR